MFLGFLLGLTNNFSNFVLICSNPLPCILSLLPKRGGEVKLSSISSSLLPDSEEPMGELVGAITFRRKSVVSITIIVYIYSHHINIVLLLVFAALHS